MQLVSMLLAVLVGSTSALSVRPALRATTPILASVRRAEDPVMVSTFAKVAALPTLYALMSGNEYVTHRWYQHEEFNRDHAFQRFCQRVAFWLKGRPIMKDGRRNLIKIFGGGHVEHHAETYDDMSLKKDSRWRKTPAAASLDSDRFRGTAFTWQVTGLMTIQMLPSTLPAFALLGFSLKATLAILLPGMLVHALVWNMLHPPMHGLPDVPISYGAPGTWLSGLRNTAYFKYIYENHQGHHVLGGQCNYNVCCPGMDHVLGTYVNPATWSKKMRAVPGPDATERWGVPVEPKGVPQAPLKGVGQSTDADLTPTGLIYN
eukprot:CAMPEP_0115867880 /NCGR_PEP_ID=MMETSP0287-20121206/20996_1 /TAXON_ID=412157 /ORGANISM="Chrysochromulina rotalis, Strain UIO044" /LENGTH=317 /DNA_ID=CAMNT_0003322499 /DNA_START=25 /DNA_END=978 /DNA_ORIENTATION=+